MPSTAARKRWREKNPDYGSQWRAKNRDKCRAYTQKYRDTHREKDRTRNTAKNREKLGVTPAQYATMHLAQGGLCMICGQPETALGRKGAVQTLCLDHNHITGKIRDLLCKRCNRVLGQLGESTELLRGMIEYIEKHSRTNA